jgi:hypothetical protein
MCKCSILDFITIQQVIFGDETSRTSDEVFLFYVCTDSQKENITPGRASLYSLQDLSLIHFVRSMSWTILQFIMIMLFYVHIFHIVFYKDT